MKRNTQCRVPARPAFVSLLAGLLFFTGTSLLQAATLSIDIDERPAPGLTQAGFDSFLIDNIGGDTALQTGSITRSFAGIDVTMMNAGDVGYDDRQRTTPTTPWLSQGPPFSQSKANIR